MKFFKTKEEKYIRKIKKTINKRGWTKGAPINQQGECCLIGAIGLIEGVKPDWNNAWGRSQPRNYQDFYDVTDESAKKKPHVKRVIDAIHMCFGANPDYTRPSSVFAHNDCCENKEELFDKLDCAIERTK